MVKEKTQEKTLEEKSRCQKTELSEWNQLHFVEPANMNQVAHLSNILHNSEKSWQRKHHPQAYQSEEELKTDQVKGMETRIR